MDSVWMEKVMDICALLLFLLRMFAKAIICILAAMFI